MVNIPSQLGEDQLFEKAVAIISEARSNVVQSIYKESTDSYFKLGKIIIEEEQAGESRAEYGSKIITNLSKRLTTTFGRGYSSTTLKDARVFFLTYQKGQSVTDQFKLNFTHYTILMRLSEPEREFYELLAIKEGYGTRELKRAIKSNTAYRMLKQGLKSNEIGIKTYPEKPEGVLKNPYVAEFLGLEQMIEGQETNIEKALVNNLEKFLLELGRGFSFVGRQYKLHISGEVFKTDLVFTI